MTPSSPSTPCGSLCADPRRPALRLPYQLQRLNCDLWRTGGAGLRSSDRTEASVPEIDELESRRSERLVHLGGVIDVMGEHPLDDRSACVCPRPGPLGVIELFAKHLDGPSVEAVFDDLEGRIQCRSQRVGADHVLQ